MIRHTQSRAFPVRTAEFAGVALRRFSVPVGACVYVLLDHSQCGKTFVVDVQPSTRAAAFVLQAEWGEPLASLESLISDPLTGEIGAYEVLVGRPNQAPQRLTLAAADVFWWEGELFCRKARAKELRGLARARSRVAPARTRAA